MPSTNGAYGANLPFSLYHPNMQKASLLQGERLRRIAADLRLSRSARARLDWIIFYLDHGRNASLTCRHFGIARKTFYQWWQRFDETNPRSMVKLADRSRAPQHVRHREITLAQEHRVLALRRQYIRYGKEKLSRLYATQYGEPLSAWKIQKVIEKHQLYYHPSKVARTTKRRLSAQKKKRLTELRDVAWYRRSAGYILCLDTITISIAGCRRYLFTAIDKYGKAAFARMYTSKSSANARDFLQRLYYLLDGDVPRVGHDNGSEFKKLFGQACRDLAIEQYWSRPHTPKDNATNERFNRTLKDEFVALGHAHTDPVVFNRHLTNWLVHYNFERPHVALNYRTPMEYSKVLPMYSSYTYSCQ